jgi:hypothetical protein
MENENKNKEQIDPYKKSSDTEWFIEENKMNVLFFK